MNKSIREILLRSIVIFLIAILTIVILSVLLEGFDNFFKLILSVIQEFSEGFKNIELDFKSLIRNEHFWVLELIAIFSIILYIITIILTKKIRKSDKEYIRDCEMVINPILAETLIDSKIGAKELVMTCVLSAIKKGALEVIDNDTIKVCDYKLLDEREKVVISMIFNNHRKSEKLKIRKIRHVFIKKNFETEKIYKQFLELKNGILEELTEKRNI